MFLIGIIFWKSIVSDSNFSPRVSWTSETHELKQASQLFHVTLFLNCVFASVIKHSPEDGGFSSSKQYDYLQRHAIVV